MPSLKHLAWENAPLTSNQPSPCEPRTQTPRRSNSGPRRQSRLSQRIDNAIHDLHTTEKSANRNRIQHARRRVSRLKRAQSRLDLRELFNRQTTVHGLALRRVVSMTDCDKKLCS
ncbi:unnamed protein product [Aphanomyces euteiches]